MYKGSPAQHPHGMRGAQGVGQRGRCLPQYEPIFAAGAPQLGFTKSLVWLWHAWPQGNAFWQQCTVETCQLGWLYLRIFCKGAAISSCNLGMIKFAQIQEKEKNMCFSWFLECQVVGSREHSCCSPARRHLGFASHLSFYFEGFGSFRSYSIERSQWCDLKLITLKKKIFFWPSDYWVIS